MLKVDYVQPGGSRDQRSTEEQIQSAEQLFSQFDSYISSVIRYFVRDECEREDIYQELFIYFVRKPLPEDVRNVKGFLYRVIADRVKDRKRKQARYHKRLEKYADITGPVSEEADAPLTDFLQKERMDRVLSVAKQYLTENEATAVMLRYKNDYDISETAKRMKVQPKTVSRYICVGLKKIRMVIQKMERAQDEGDSHGL